MLKNKTQMVARIALALSLLMASSGAVQAQSKSLDKCQKAAAKQAGGFVAARTKALQKCLQKISGELIKSNALDTSGAAKACASSFRKLVNTEVPTKTLAEKAKGKMRKACDPSLVPALAHTTAQVLNTGDATGLQAKNIEGYCQTFGGDGTFTTVEEWVNCQVAGGTCESNQNISVQYPRALEWLADVQIRVGNLGMDAKYTDAVTAIQQVRLALDANSDLAFDINCGPGNGLCGNGSIDANEQCDGANLGGQTCTSQGFPQGGILSCQGNCGFNYQGCNSGMFSQTGQIVVFQTQDDGDVQAGPPFNFVDNGTGTITDNNTNLMWEKLSDDGTIHDQNNGHKWFDTVAIDVPPDAFDKMTALNTMPCFAGFCDWRLPNIRELQSILDLGANSPALRTEFSNGCTLNCTVLTCSCGPPTTFWSSTTHATSTGQAWFINFSHGRIDPNPKSISQAVRAVRGP